MDSQMERSLRELQGIREADEVFVKKPSFSSSLLAIAAEIDDLTMRLIKLKKEASDDQVLFMSNAIGKLNEATFFLAPPIIRRHE